MLRKSTLPPKKRAFVERSSSVRPEQNDMSVDQARSSSIALVSADDRSVASFSGSTTCSSVSHRELVGNPPSQILSSITEVKRAAPFISNDVTFVAKTLLQRDQNEILRASKVMLLHAYMQALHGGQGIAATNAKAP